MNDQTRSATMVAIMPNELVTSEHIASSFAKPIAGHRPAIAVPSSHGEPTLAPTDVTTGHTGRAPKGRERLRAAVPCQDASAGLGGWCQFCQLTGVVQKLRRRVDLIRKLTARKFNKLGDEVVPPGLVSREVNALCNDGLGVNAKTRGL